MRVHVIMLAAFLALAPQVPAAEATKVGNVIIHDAWMRAPLDVDNSSAAYMTFEVEGQPGRSPAGRSDVCG